jgi:hypothetical protein
MIQGAQRKNRLHNTSASAPATPKSFSDVLKLLDRNNNGQVDKVHTIIEFTGKDNRRDKRIFLRSKDELEAGGYGIYIPDRNPKIEEQGVDEIGDYLKRLVASVKPDHLPSLDSTLDYIPRGKEEWLRKKIKQDLAISISRKEFQGARAEVFAHYDTGCRTFTVLQIVEVRNLILKKLRSTNPDFVIENPGFVTEEEWKRASKL